MMEVAVSEAEKRLGALLDRVQGGEEVLITRDGKPVARLVPDRAMHDAKQSKAANERMRTRAAAQKIRVDWADLKQERDEERP